jgi:HemY protein
VLILAWEQWLIEMPLWLAGLGTLALTMACYILILGGYHLTRIGDFFVRLGQSRRQRRARDLTNRGLIAFAEGQWANAEKGLVQGARDSETPLLNYLTAAKAAQEQSAVDRRDRYLRLAHDAVSNADVAIGLSQAQLQLSGGQYQQCLATLAHLRSIAPDHRHVLKLMMQVHQALNDWTALQKLLPELVRDRILPPVELTSLERQVYKGLLAQSIVKPSFEPSALKALWQKVPLEVKNDTVVVSMYVKALLQVNQEAEAENVLRSALKSQWQDDWVALYGQLQGACLQKQLQHAEGWLKEQANNPTLLLTLGRLCLKSQLWGKAQRYFESSLGLSPNPQTHAELARLLDRLGKAEESAQHYRKGLLLAAPVITLPRESASFTSTTV